MTERAVYKSTSAEFLDDLFGGSPDELAAQYEQSLGLLDDIGDAPLSEAIERLAADGGLPDGSVEHSEKGWRGRPDVDRVIRAGYREAIRMASAGDVPMPIETLWVSGASDTFELHVCEGRRAITVLFFLPIQRDYGSERAQARSWVFRVGGSSDEIDAFGLGETGGPEIVQIQVSGGGRAAAG
jgi:hypothetical protein